MNDKNQPESVAHAVANKFGARSTVVEKLSSELRRQVDDAIIMRKPATFRGIFEHFHLASKGLSFMAFYRYASRVRFTAGLVEHARLIAEDGLDVRRRLPEIVAARILDAALDESASARNLQRLADAYRMISRVNFDGEKLAISVRDAVKESPASVGGPFSELRDHAARSRAEEELTKEKAALEKRAKERAARREKREAQAAAAADPDRRSAEVDSQCHAANMAAAIKLDEETREAAFRKELGYRTRQIYQLPICPSREECAKPKYCEYPQCYVPPGWKNPFPKTKDSAVLDPAPAEPTPEDDAREEATDKERVSRLDTMEKKLERYRHDPRPLWQRHPASEVSCQPTAAPPEASTTGGDGHDPHDSHHSQTSHDSGDPCDALPPISAASPADDCDARDFDRIVAEICGREAPQGADRSPSEPATPPEKGSARRSKDGKEASGVVQPTSAVPPRKKPSHAEFVKTLNQAAFEIYGIPIEDLEKSFLPPNDTPTDPPTS